MALKNAANDIIWRKHELEHVSSSITVDLLKDIYNEGLDGYTLTKRITDKFSSQLEKEFPAFAAVVKFEDTVKSPETTTGWYMPSASEWIDILGNKGLNVIEKQDIDKVKESNEGEFGFDNISKTIVQKLNSRLEKAGESNFDKFIEKNQEWSSTELKEPSAFIIEFGWMNELVFTREGFDGENTVRTVLAF